MPSNYDKIRERITFENMAMGPVICPFWAGCTQTEPISYLNFYKTLRMLVHRGSFFNFLKASSRFFMTVGRLMKGMCVAFAGWVKERRLKISLRSANSESVSSQFTLTQ